jgi:hypothetical protein
MRESTKAQRMGKPVITYDGYTKTPGYETDVPIAGPG